MRRAATDKRIRAPPTSPLPPLVSCAEGVARNELIKFDSASRSFRATVVLALDILLAADVIDALSQPIDEVAFATLYKISIVVIARTVLAITLGQEIKSLEDALEREQAAGLAR